LSSGYVIFAHGSSVESANDAVRAVAAEAARRGGLDPVETAFLGGGSPDLEEAVARLARTGVSRIVVIPYFLTLGLHMQRDLPEIVRRLESIHRGLRVSVTEPLDGHPALAQMIVDRANASDRSHPDREP